MLNADRVTHLRQREERDRLLALHGLYDGRDELAEEACRQTVRRMDSRQRWLAAIQEITK